MDAEVVVPVALFMSVAAVLGLYFWFRFRNRAEMQQTVRAALDKGHELTPEIIDRLGQPRQLEDADRRRAVIAMALGAAVAAFGFILGERDAVRPLLAISAFPFIIGIAYLIIWRLTGSKPSS